MAVHRVLDETEAARDALVAKLATAEKQNKLSTLALRWRVASQRNQHPATRGGGSGGDGPGGAAVERRGGEGGDPQVGSSKGGVHESAQDVLGALQALLVRVLAMRERGEYDENLVQQYGDQLVTLPDETLGEVYALFTQVYTGSDDVGEALAWMGLETLSEAAYDFIEMQTMRVGTLLETPLSARVAQLERERARLRAQQARASALHEKRQQEAERVSQLRLADQVAYEAQVTL